MSKQDFHAITTFLIAQFLISLFLIVAYYNSRNISCHLALSTGNNVILAEVAPDSFSRRKGLSGMEDINNIALLMVYPVSAKHCIWTKGVNFDLDVVFIDKNIVKDIKLNIPAQSDKKICPSSDVNTILEMKAGSVKKYDLKKGQRISFSPYASL